jgi:hypothetical protein
LVAGKVGGGGGGGGGRTRLVAEVAGGGEKRAQLQLQASWGLQSLYDFLEVYLRWNADLV